jgi:hypothetical protein
MTTALAKAPLGGGLVIEAGNEEFEATCAHMAQEYAEATAEIRRLAAALDGECRRLFDAFKGEMKDYAFNPFEITLYHEGRRYYRCETKNILDGFKRRAWDMLFDRLGVKKVMSVAKREEFEKRLKEGELPEITAESVCDVILGMVDQARDFAEEAAREVFEFLRPWRGDYKTNSAFKIGKKVILSYAVERGWGEAKKFRPTHYKEPKLVALDGVFHLLDGRGVMGERLGPLVKAIKESADGKGETALFKFRCFKNGNLHLEFKRPDLVKQLNALGAGRNVLGAEGG